MRWQTTDERLVSSKASECCCVASDTTPPKWRATWLAAHPCPWGGPETARGPVAASPNSAIVVSVGAGRFARTIDQLVADARRMIERRQPDAPSRLFSHAFQLFTGSDVLGAPDLSSNSDARATAAQIVNQLASALLELRAAIDRESEAVRP